MPYFLNSFTILQYTPLKTQDLTIPTQSAVFSATRRRWKGAVTKALFSRRIVPRSTDVSYASRIFIRCFCYHDLLTTLCSIQSHTSPTCMHIASTGELFVMRRCRSREFVVACILRLTTPAAPRFLWPRANQPVAIILLAGPSPCGISYRTLIPLHRPHRHYPVANTRAVATAVWSLRDV